MSGFSNFAISFSIICILAGGITSFQLGTRSAGGAAPGIGVADRRGVCAASSRWHGASRERVSDGGRAVSLVLDSLGGRGGWATAWFNLLGSHLSSRRR